MLAHADGQPAAHAEEHHVAIADVQHGSAQAAHADGQHGSHAQGQQHPHGLYFKLWGLRFVLSTASYLVGYRCIEGYLRWGLIIAFMLLKAGLIVAVFMHML